MSDQQLIRGEIRTTPPGHVDLSFYKGPVTVRDGSTSIELSYYQPAAVVAETPKERLMRLAAGAAAPATIPLPEDGTLNGAPIRVISMASSEYDGRITILTCIRLALPD